MYHHTVSNRGKAINFLYEYLWRLSKAQMDELDKVSKPAIPYPYEMIMRKVVDRLTRIILNHWWKMSYFLLQGITSGLSFPKCSRLISILYNVNFITNKRCLFCVKKIFLTCLLSKDNRRKAALDLNCVIVYIIL